MRVISGKYKGKNIEGFNIEGTRPTMDRVKESFFGSIQMKVPNSICLDLFAGSGSLGLEALSNGAKKCYFVDKNPIAIKTLKKNLNGIENSIIYHDDYHNFLNNTSEKFDLIFLDPPYSLFLISDCLNIIESRELLNPGGMIVCEYEKEIFESNLNIYREKKYGTTHVRIYQK